MSRRTAFIVGACALALLLAIAPFLPRELGGKDDDQGALAPQAAQQPLVTQAPVAGEVTPDLQAEIDRVVADGQRQPKGRLTPRQLVASQVRCATFEQQTYCLGSGWTHQSESEVRARTVVAARTIAARPAPTESTGDLDSLAALQQRAMMNPRERARAERRELTDAARSVAKIWALRQDLEGAQLPDGFLDRHPEAAASQEEIAARTVAPAAGPSKDARPVRVAKGYDDYSQRATVLNPKQVADQTRSYWCGPTAMQMIAWGWDDKSRSQTTWANRLGTTSSGTAITEMVRVVNRYTGWDGDKYAGNYITLDISNYSYAKWYLLLMRHFEDYKAPVVLHPILLKKYYPYLDDDASGHFQAGRGYDKNGNKSDRISFFEPWNQQRFDPSEPYIERVQWRSGYRSYRANQAHFQHNIGV
jgi:Peptidase_C39 like family